MARIYPAPSSGGGEAAAEENPVADQIDAMVSYG